MMAEDQSVAGFIRTMSSTKASLEVHALKKAIDIAQSSNRGSASEIIDLAYSITGYGKADLPGGETQVTGSCLTTLVKYMTLRAKEATNESLEEVLLTLINETTRLYSEVQFNKGVRVIPQTMQAK
jgi:hypothetical protein